MRNAQLMKCPCGPPPPSGAAGRCVRLTGFPFGKDCPVSSSLLPILTRAFACSPSGSHAHPLARQMSLQPATAFRRCRPLRPLDGLITAYSDMHLNPVRRNCLSGIHNSPRSRSWLHYRCRARAWGSRILRLFLCRALQVRALMSG